MKLLLGLVISAVLSAIVLVGSNTKQCYFGSLKLKLTFTRAF